MNLRNKYTFSALAGLTLITALAGCSSTAAPTGSTSTAPATTQPATTQPAASPSASTSTSTSTSTYKDGTDTEDGSYKSPAGLATITVKLTLASGVVTAVTVNGHATDATAKSYQTQFDNGISGKVVGKKIDALEVTKVAGSSLTSGGFDDAVKKIETDASA